MNTYTKPLALATTILLSATFAAPAQAEQPKKVEESITAPIPEIKAPNAKISFDHVDIGSFEGSAPQEPAPTPEQTAPSQEVAYADPAPATPPPTPQTPPQPVAAPQTANVSQPVAAPKAPPAASASGKGASIAAAAYAQIGMPQDCTMLVTNSLAAVGINFHGWPNEYASLGTPTGSPQAGDILIYQNAGAGVPHVAIYVGNGQAIHGGWNGGTTVLFSAMFDKYTPIAIRVA